jgi:tetratricopeptide (TPR) repeat protein
MAYYKQALCYISLKNPTKALELLSKALFINESEENINDSILFYHERAGLRLQLRQFPEALSDYQRILHYNPQYWQAYLGQGITFEVLQEWDKAFLHYQKILSLQKNSFEAYQGCAQISRKQKKI